MAAVAPLAVLSMLVGSILLSQGTLRHADPVMPASPVRVDAAKIGDEVVFRIHNGGREHTVSRSEIPRHFDGGPSVEVSAGQFRDRLDSESRIVFYRID
jgi:hypothetical protein